MVEALLMWLAKRYANKGIPLEDLYQEAWIAYLEKPSLNVNQICSRVRTRLGRALAKEYRYNKREKMKTIQPVPTATPEDIMRQKELLDMLKDTQ